MKPRPSSWLCAALLAAAACNSQDDLTIPNRVLDRPMDAVLACVASDSDATYVGPQPLSACRGSLDTSLANPCATAGAVQLVGFVANSEKNEVAMFAECLGGLVDMDPNTPGYQFIPVGGLPSSMTRTPDNCWAVSSNFGTCDLSVLDIPGLASYAVGVVPPAEPGALVTRLIPRRGDGTPLGARPGEILAVPTALSNATTLEDIGDTDTDTDTDGDEIGVLKQCSDDIGGSVYVTFPACNLIAEVDLLTQQILQSRQFVRDGEGAVTVVDTGVNPLCPVDCPGQFEGAIPDSPPYDPDGVFPNTLNLVTRNEYVGTAECDDPNSILADPADCQVEDDALFVAGTGADQIFELRYDGTSWVDEALSLELPRASGVTKIRATPAMELTLDGNSQIYYQFLYVIAGDGSTRVVSRELSPSRAQLGVECDTQIDPNEAFQVSCAPATDPQENPPDRRALVDGPGIRVPTGDVVTDWSFQKIGPNEAGCLTDDNNGGMCAQGVEPANGTAPFQKPGVIGIGVTTGGRIVFSTFGQFERIEVGDASLDPLDLMDRSIRPHFIWPQESGLANTDTFPQVVNQVPSRAISGTTQGGNLIKLLTPALRRIDLAYLTERRPTTLLTGEGGAAVTNADELGTFEDDQVGVTAFYSEDVARVVARDYRSWTVVDWLLSWEGSISQTESSTGQFKCDEPGWNEATCLSTQEGDTRLYDAGAQFCDDGVLAGDKLFVYGCTTDDDCGAGRVCVAEENSVSTGATGICMSEATVEEQGLETLRQVCAEFIHDACGSVVREYLVTRAFQDELWLQTMDRRKTSYLLFDETADPVQVIEREGRLLCAEDQPEGGCDEDKDCDDSFPEIDEAARDYYDFVCLDGLCQRNCVDEDLYETDSEGNPVLDNNGQPIVAVPAEECLLRRLPGPRCFPELVRYQVNARNSFVLTGNAPYDFLADRVKADASGECFEDTEVSTLLTSRIRLGEDFEDTVDNDAWPMAACVGDEAGPDSPNPCYIEGQRPSIPTSDNSRFHKFLYDGREVQAIRFSNPMMSLTLDLTSLLDLDAEIPGHEGARWPAEFADFRRSRIPRLYTQLFRTVPGYIPYNEGVVLNGEPLLGPVRVINAPEKGAIFIVDAGGRGSVYGLRGQVMRVRLVPQVLADDTFEVR